MMISLPAAAAEFTPVELPLPAGRAVAAVLDANGDEVPDLAVFSLEGEATLLLSAPRTGWEKSPLDTQKGGTLTVLAADLDNDMHPDLVISGREGTSVLLHDGRKGFRAPQRLEGTEPFMAGAASLSAGDVNGDGLLDILETRNDGNRGALRLWLSEPVAKGEAPKWRLTRPLGEAPCCVPAKALLAELDGDGNLDMLVAQRAGPLEIHRGLGGHEGRFEKHAHEVAGTWAHLDAGDVDNDGDLDLLLSGQEPAVALYLNDGGFKFRQSVNVLPAVTAPAVAPRFVDFDSDGRLDIALSASARWLQDFEGRFRAYPAALSVPADAGYGIGDLNGDGYPDLLVTASGAAPRLFVQPTGPYHWLFVRLRGDGGRAVTGTRITAKLPDGRRTVRHVLLGDTVASSSAEGTLLGILRHTQVNTLEVHWFSGRYTRLDEPLVKRPIGFIEPPASEPRQVALSNPVLEHYLTRKPAKAPQICRRDYRPPGAVAKPKPRKIPPATPATP